MSSRLYKEFTPDIFDEQYPQGLAVRTEVGGEGLSYGANIGAEGLSYGSNIGVAGYGQSFGVEVGAQQDAILRTITRARDNRRPAPPMRAVSADARNSADRTLVGMCGGPGEELFPLTASLLRKYSDGTEGQPRMVRVDTEESYKAFRTAASPERTALAQRIAEVEAKVAAHIANPNAHNPMPSRMEEELEEVTQMGALVAQSEADKRIPLRMPRHFDGLMEAWHEDGSAGASMLLPREDGGRWVITAAEPLEIGELEAAKAATEAGVASSDIAEYLPAIGATLAAGTAVKELAAGAESILRRPEAKIAQPFSVRLEPKTHAPLYALAALAKMCCDGNKDACDEWARLGSAAPPPLKQAMDIVLRLVKQRAEQTTLGGIGDFFSGLWDKIRHLFGGGHHKGLPVAPIATTPPKALPAKAAA